jgi:hypothetical protein
MTALSCAAPNAVPYVIACGAAQVTVGMIWTGDTWT